MRGRTNVAYAYDYGGDAGGGGAGGGKYVDDRGKEKPMRDEFGRDIDRGSKDDESKSSRKRRGSPPEDTGRTKRR